MSMDMLLQAAEFLECGTGGTKTATTRASKQMHMGCAPTGCYYFSYLFAFNMHLINGSDREYSVVDLVKRH